MESTDQDKSITWRDWHVPLARNDVTLQEIIDSAAHLAADADDIPLIIQMIENPKFDIPGITLRYSRHYAVQWCGRPADP